MSDAQDIEVKKKKLLEMIKLFLEKQVDWDDEKVGGFMLEAEKLSPDPSLFGYVLFPNNYGYDDDLTPEEIVDICFSYKPIITPPP